tara:strand:+ start:337 stop:1077 length:741 start_codon:yes stop_codon:yes gene_type:complete
MSQFTDFFPASGGGGGGTEINGGTYYGATTLKAMPRTCYNHSNASTAFATTEGNITIVSPTNTNMASTVTMTNNTVSQQVVNNTAGANGSAMTSLWLYNTSTVTTNFVTKLVDIEFVIDSVSTTLTNQPVVIYPFGNRTGTWAMGTHYITNVDNNNNERYLTPGGLPTDSISATSQVTTSGTPTTLGFYIADGTQTRSYINIPTGPMAVSSGYPWIFYNTSLVINVQASVTDGGSIVANFSGHDFA